MFASLVCSDRVAGFDLVICIISFLFFTSIRLKPNGFYCLELQANSFSILILNAVMFGLVQMLYIGEGT